MQGFAAVSFASLHLNAIRRVQVAMVGMEAYVQNAAVGLPTLSAAATALLAPSSRAIAP